MNAQRTWDECLISAWRSDGVLFCAINEWQRITGLSFEEHLQDLRRAPPWGYPWKSRSRVFVAQFLDKISNRLWNQPPERDAALIDKLQTSTYTSLRGPESEGMRELRKEQRALRKNREKIALNVHIYGERNSRTDWGVTKSARGRIGRVR